MVVLAVYLHMQAAKPLHIPHWTDSWLMSRRWHKRAHRIFEVTSGRHARAWLLEGRDLAAASDTLQLFSCLKWCLHKTSNAARSHGSIGFI